MYHYIVHDITTPWMELSKSIFKFSQPLINKPVRDEQSEILETPSKQCYKGIQEMSHKHQDSHRF